MAKREGSEPGDKQSPGGGNASSPDSLGDDTKGTLLTASIVEHLPDMVFVKEAKELRFVQFNRAAELILGYPREALLGKNDFDLFPQEEANAYVERDREVLREGKMLEVAEEPLHTAAGLRTLRTKKVPIFDQEGRATHLLGISEDITELRAVQSDLHNTRDDLVASRLREAQKSQLLARVSPPTFAKLTKILVDLEQSAQLLADQEDLSTQHNELTERILESTRQMSQCLAAASKVLAPHAHGLAATNSAANRASSSAAKRDAGDIDSFDLQGVRVLFADDEAPMRKVAEIVLSRAGASVVAVANGQDACQAFQNSPSEFDIILLDLSMPIMGGYEALTIIRQISALVPVLISTGHESGDPALSATNVGFLQKPYRAAALTEAVVEMLQGGAAAD